MPYALGLDCSTQSLTALLVDLDTYKIHQSCSVSFGKDLSEYQAPNGYIPDMPDGQVHADPRMWLDALDVLCQRMREQGIDLSAISCIGGSGQQHANVYLNQQFEPTLAALDCEHALSQQLAPCLSRATSPIWMDQSTSAQCQAIEAAIDAIGGDSVCQRSGSVATERFSGPQIRRFSELDPAAWQDTAHVHLASSFMCSVLAGRSAPIDYGDGAGMNLLNLAKTQWDSDLISATAPDLANKLPELAASTQVVGTINSYFVERYGFAADCQVSTFSGDNPCSLVGMGASQPGRLIISLGTSDTLFASLQDVATDPAGYGHVFGNPMGGFMSLVCFRNGSLAREQCREQLELDWETAAGMGHTQLAADQVSRPFALDEMTPKLSAGVLESHGDAPALERIRAFIEGQMFNMRAASAWIPKSDGVYVTGGASRNSGIVQVIADVFDAPAERLATDASAALGAAMIAAVASGHELAQLDRALCCPDSDSRREPNVTQAAAVQQRFQLWRQQCLNDPTPSGIA